ncbi:Arabinosidase A [Pestalotiopsis sp. NC0098]|nr:Arabinosidase A [Pestalotiopsis sp. NC0098]
MRPSLRLLAGLAMTSLIKQSLGITLTVSQEPGNATSNKMWGLMFEDINHSGDGGIHGQLLRNNGFQGTDPGLTAYFAVGDTELAVASAPLSSAISNTLQVSVAAESTGQVGFGNEGYWGIPVDGSIHNHTIFIRGAYQGSMIWSLVSNSSGEVFDNGTFDVSSESDTFTEYTSTAESSRTSATDVQYRLTFDAAQVAGSSLVFGLPQLYATTFAGRQNGLKSFMADALSDIGGSFLRFPGGNNLEGPNVANRWKWNETVGPLVSRPGHQEDAGLHEYFEWCEDMNLDAYVGIYSGYSLDGTSITGSALDPYVDDALNELEYILGDASTPMGSWRASNGRQEPWTITWLEIGNEDDFACSTYAERFTAFYDAISSTYPDLQLVASATGFNCLPDPFPENVWIDYHEYNIPENYVANFNQWANVARTNKYIIGEMARWGVEWSDMQGSVSEAVFMLGLERNSDLIQGAAFAPLLSLIDDQQWTPNLIPYHQSPDGLVLTSSYWTQQLFAQNSGDMTHAVSSDTGFGPVYWSAVSSGTAYVVKLANYGAESQALTIGIAGKTAATLSVLGNDDPTAANTDVASPIAAPVFSTISGDSSFSFTLPPWSVAVLRAY